MDNRVGKVLVVYYSRTGTTKSVAQAVVPRLSADVEEVVATRDRRGFWGWIISGKEGALRQPASIQPLQKSAADYDLIVIGTPVWASNMSSPIRAYINNLQDRSQKAAFFCTSQGSGGEKALTELERLWGSTPVAALPLTEKEVKQDSYLEKLELFLKDAKRAI